MTLPTTQRKLFGAHAAPLATQIGTSLSRRIRPNPLLLSFCEASNYCTWAGIVQVLSMMKPADNVILLYI